MSIRVFLKILCDCCVLIGILGTMPDFFPNAIPLIIPAVACAISAAGACCFRRKGKVVFSVIIAAIPLFLLRSAGNLKEMLILIPAIVYAVLYGILGRFELEYVRFRKEYPRNAMLLFAWFYATILISDIDLDHLYMPDTAFWFGVLYLVSGVLLLQQLRMGNCCDQRSNWVQYSLILGGTSCVVSAYFLVRQMILTGSQLIYKLFATIVMYFQDAVYNLFDIDGYNEYREMKIENTAGPEGAAPPPPPEVGSAELPQEAVQEERWIFIVVILCVMILFAVIMLATTQKLVQSEDGESYTGSVFRFRRDKKSPNSTNRSKIRKYYREYLRIERGRGVKLRGYMTSADILSAVSSQTNRNAAEKLREVYVAARYRENSEITPEQVQTAKLALKQIRGASQK